MKREEVKKKIAAYEQQAEISLANFHRLKGAAIALQELLKEMPAEDKAEPPIIAVEERDAANLALG